MLPGNQGQLAVGSRLFGDDQGKDRLWLEETAGLEIEPASRFIAYAQFKVFDPVGRPHGVQILAHGDLAGERFACLDGSRSGDDRGMPFLKGGGLGCWILNAVDAGEQGLIDLGREIMLCRCQLCCRVLAAAPTNAVLLNVRRSMCISFAAKLTANLKSTTNAQIHHRRSARDFSMKWATFLLSLREYVKTGKGQPSPHDQIIDNWH